MFRPRLEQSLYANDIFITILESEYNSYYKQELNKASIFTQTKKGEPV